MIRVYYHPRSPQDMRRARQGFTDATIISRDKPMVGVVLDNDPEPPWKRASYHGQIFNVSREYSFDGVVEIGIPDERLIADYEIETELGRRRWCVPAELLNRELRTI